MPVCVWNYDKRLLFSPTQVEVSYPICFRKKTRMLGCKATIIPIEEKQQKTLSLSAVSKSNDSQPNFVPWLDESAKISPSSSFVTDKAFGLHFAPEATSFSFFILVFHR
uniref:Fe-S metabolism associated domain-containing protein n=2 Tax=Solanum tuberosum TaxID=4113 RepID=M1AUJ7_SOLTU